MDTLVAGPSTDLARFAPDGPEPQVLHASDRQKVVLLALEDGQSIPPHAPEVDLTLVVTHGTGEVATDAGQRPVQAGDVIVVPAGAIRGVRARGGRLVAVLVVSPPPSAADHDRRGAADEWSAPAPVERDVATAIHEEHGQLHGSLAELVAIADGLDGLSDGELRGRLAGILTFLHDELLPHAHVEDAALYPAIDRLLQAVGGATATMSVDHRAVARRVDQLAVAGDELDEPGRSRVRRLLHELHALLEVHFTKEEEVYLPLLGRLTADQHARLLDELHHAHHQVGDGVPRAPQDDR